MIALRRAVVLAVVVVAAAGCDKDKDRKPAGERTPPTTPTTPTPTGPTATADPSGWVEIPGNRPIGVPMAEHAAAAIKAGKKPYAYLHASWCKPCVALQKYRTHPRMQKAFAGTYIIGLDIDQVPEQQLIDQSLPFSVIPVFYRLDETGVPSGDSLDGGAWGDDLLENMAPVLTAFFAK